MPDNKPKEHHYVPQGYMRGFCETKNVLFVANKEYGSIRQSSPKGIGYVEDFYTVDTIDEKDSAEVEEGLSKIETKCIPLMEKLVRASDLPNPEWADIAIYIALQYGRTPTARARMDELATIITTNELKQHLANAINDPSKYDELVDIVARSNPETEMPTRNQLIEWVLKPGPLASINIDNGTYVQSFFRMAWEIGDGLLKTQWTIFHAPQNSQFITSDNPVCLSIDRKLEEHETLAILLPGVVRYFPINAKICLVMTDEPVRREILHATISRREVRMINKIIYVQAQKYVLSGNRSLLESLMSSR